MPNNLLSSVKSRLAITKCLKKMLASKETQPQICDVYYAEMNELINCEDAGLASHKRGRHSAKHFWTNELPALWENGKLSEKIFLQSETQINRKKQLQNT